MINDLITLLFAVSTFSAIMIVGVIITELISRRVK